MAELISKFFPRAELADEEGLVGVGGDLEPERLLDAYTHGIFPWPIDDDGPLLWWSPDPRAILELDQLHVSRRLQRTLRSGRFEATIDRDFAAVIEQCATVEGRLGETWLTDDMIAAYTRLHRLGFAHSVEVWSDGCLAGGTYGLAIAGLFAAESMFFSVRDASKIAVACLVTHLRKRGYQLLDLQQLTDHTASFGAVEISRAQYLERLAAALALPVTFGTHHEGEWSA